MSRHHAPSVRTDLTRVFDARTIAIAGYSERPESWSNKIHRAIVDGGFAGRVVALRPRTEPSAIDSVQSLTEGEPIDLLVIAVPAAAVIEIVAEARDAGVGAALVVTAGFAESGDAGLRLQRELVDAAGAMPVIGPNSVGLLNYRSGLHVSASPFAERVQPPPVAVAVVAQSGAVGFTLIDQLNRYGAPAGYYVSAGNEALMDTFAIAQNLLERDDVEVVGLYLESVRTPAAVTALGRRARQLGKGVVALVSGRSEAGQRAAQSHTAAAVSNDLLLAAVLREAGIAMAEDEESWAAAVSVRAAAGRAIPERPRRLAVLTMSGGAGAIIADRMGALGVEVPMLDETTVERIESLAPFVASPQNPVDVGGMFLRHLDDYAALLDLLDDSDAVDAVVCYATCGDHTQKEYRAIAEKLAGLGKPGWLVWSGAAPGALADVGHPGVVLPSIGAFAHALASLPRSTDVDDRGAIEQLSSDVRARVAALLATSGDTPIRTETMMAGVFAAAGARYAPTVSWPLTEVYRDAVVDHYPAVAKLDSAQTPHRGKLGLVHLNLQTPTEVEAAATAIARRADELGIDPERARIAIQQQCDFVAEFAVGAIRDDAYGTFLVVGPGGSKVEDASPLRQAFSLPLEDGAFEQAHTAASAVAGREVDRDGLERIIATVEFIMAEAEDIAEIDLNPVVVDRAGEPMLIDSLAIGRSVRS